MHRRVVDAQPAESSPVPSDGQRMFGASRTGQGCVARERSSVRGGEAAFVSPKWVVLRNLDKDDADIVRVRDP